MIFVGMDVHVRNSFFHATDETGRRLGHRRCSNEPGELAAFCRELVAKNKGECAPTRVVLESTTNSRAMQRMIREAATLCGEPVTVDVLDARRLRIIAESVCKTDGIDAKVLCDLARSNFDLPKCYMPDDEEFALREHLRARSDLVRMRTMVKNRIHAVLHRRGILSPRNGLFTIAGRDFLQEATLDEAGRTILERYLVLLDGLEKRIDESTKDLRILMRRDRWAKPASLLQTMPGIGLITALVILAELGDLSRFRSRAAVANYAGLVPVIRDSNTKHYSGGISHRGSAHLRQVMVEAAWVAFNRVPVYQSIFDRVAERRGRQTAIVSVARRMLEDAARMLWKKEPFRYVPAPQSNGSSNESGSTEATGAPRVGRSAGAKKAQKKTPSIEIASSVAG